MNLNINKITQAYKDYADCYFSGSQYDKYVNFQINKQLSILDSFQKVSRASLKTVLCQVLGL